MILVGEDLLWYKLECENHHWYLGWLILLVTVYLVGNVLKIWYYLNVWFNIFDKIVRFNSNTKQFCILRYIILNIRRGCISIIIISSNILHENAVIATCHLRHNCSRTAGLLFINDIHFKKLCKEVLSSVCIIKLPIY